MDEFLISTMTEAETKRILVNLLVSGYLLEQWDIENDCPQMLRKFMRHDRRNNFNSLLQTHNGVTYVSNQIIEEAMYQVAKISDEPTHDLKEKIEVLQDIYRVNPN